MIVCVRPQKSWPIFVNPSEEGCGNQKKECRRDAMPSQTEEDWLRIGGWHRNIIEHLVTCVKAENAPIYQQPRALRFRSSGRQNGDLRRAGPTAPPDRSHGCQAEIPGVHRSKAHFPEGWVV